MTAPVRIVTRIFNNEFYPLPGPTATRLVLSLTLENGYFIILLSLFTPALLYCYVVRFSRPVVLSLT